jgi:hypothetical protein
MACNGMFGCGKEGLINACDFNKTFELKKAKIILFDQLAFQLKIDFFVWLW